jgi:hypothetical protein
MITTLLTVFFDDPFWVGVCETTEDDKLTACRIVFGSEPKDYEVYAYILQNWYRLQFSPPVPSESHEAIRINPKRMQRQAKAQLEQTGVGTKAQQALKAQQEMNKNIRKQTARQRSDMENDRIFKIKQEKKKKKHKGH